MDNGLLYACVCKATYKERFDPVWEELTYFQCYVTIKTRYA